MTCAELEPVKQTEYSAVFLLTDTGAVGWVVRVELEPLATRTIEVADRVVANLGAAAISPVRDCVALVHVCNETQDVTEGI